MDIEALLNPVDESESHVMDEVTDEVIFRDGCTGCTGRWTN
jgi:hypothetical protein